VFEEALFFTVSIPLVGVVLGVVGASSLGGIRASDMLEDGDDDATPSSWGGLMGAN